MHYLIYVSQAERPMSAEELAQLLNKSRARNNAAGITGLLIYKNSHSGERANFMQLLEGDREAVERLYRQIAEDPRHHTKIVLEEGEVPARNFPDWSMGFRNLAPDSLAEFEGFSDLGSPAFWERARQGSCPSCLNLMKFFYDGDE